MAEADLSSDVKRRWRTFLRTMREAVMADADIYWEGKSGREYRFWIHRIGTHFNDEPGNFIYAREVEPDAWEAVYMGHTPSLQDRLADAATEACAKRHGATHVHVHTTPGPESRRNAEQEDLIARWNPSCNQTETPSRRQDQESPDSA